ncbi:MAG TPA: ankyrin repeat domain-containing protein [Bryobacteraceae bacterium]|nr:ankyrin repeat domain-containing protein [Bryobacteraceae bacterium]
MRRPDELRTDGPLLWSVGTGREVWKLLRAAADGDLPGIRKLLKKNPALIRAHAHYRTPLYMAVRENQAGAVQLLLARMGDPLSLAVNDTLLTMARERGYLAVQQILEEHLALHFQISERGEPVAAAIREKNLRKVKQLLDASPELVHAGDERGNQPIHWAVMTRQVRMIDAVLARGADINAQRFDGARPIQLTNGDYNYRGWRDVPAGTKTKPREVLQYLRDKGAECDLCTASYIGDEEQVRALLAADPGLANRPSAYVTYYACSGTPIRNAAAGGHASIVRLLLEHGADPNLPEEGIAPLGHALHMAVCNGHREIVELLLAHGAHPNVPIESSADTLSAALRNEDKSMAELLASHGAARGLNLLAYYGDVVTAAAMISANPKLADDTEALCYAAEEGHEAFVRLLLHYRPKLAKRVGVGGKTAAITQLLFAHGMDPHFRDWLDATPLHHFARRGDTENAALFLDQGAEIDALEEDQRSTPLGWAARHGQPAMAELLLARGARTDLPAQPDWARPRAWAERRGHTAIVDLLDAHDAMQRLHGDG